MEIYNIEKDILVICLTATSFPEGIMEAFNTLHSKLSGTHKRGIFGISYPGKDGSIIYKAAASALHGSEAAESGLESFIIKKGAFISIFIPDFMNDVQRIGQAFTALLKYPGIDPNGYCLEMYLGPDVRCMVGIIDSKQEK